MSVGQDRTARTWTLFIEPLHEGAPAFVRTQRLQMLYARPPQGGPSTVEQRVLRGVFARLARAEGRLVAMLESPAASAIDAPMQGGVEAFAHAEELLDPMAMLANRVYRQHVRGSTVSLSPDDTVGRPLRLAIDLGVPCAQACRFCPASFPRWSSWCVRSVRFWPSSFSRPIATQRGGSCRRCCRPSTTCAKS